MSTTFTELPGDTHAERPFIARMLHILALPIILFWLAIAVILSLFVPSLEEVGQQRSVSLSPSDAPSLVAMKHIGHAFWRKEKCPTAVGDDRHRG